ncbi:MAG: Gfo/Idh/MocA family protein [Verrucomicrobiota bacterium]
MVNHPIKLGIVGIGRAGWGMHCKELAGREDKFNIAAACDVIPERCQKMADHYGCKTYNALEELIADPDVEVVDIATRSIDHYEHARLALEAGKTVFLEKPICRTYEEAVKLREVEKTTNGVLYFRHNRRFEKAFCHIREIITSGILGEIFEIKLRRGSYQRREDWQTLKKFGGGQLLNWGPHIIDQGLRLLEAEPESMWSDLKRIAAVGDAEDYFKILLRGQNNRVVDMEMSGGRTVQEAEFMISGDRGGLWVDKSGISMKYLDPEQRLEERAALSDTPPETGSFGSSENLNWIEETVEVNPSSSDNPESVWDYLYESVRHNKSFPITWDEVLAVMKVVSDAKQGTDFAE